ncbi:MAG: NAD(P)/FAD-dependent oxidoreductase [Candidatus Eremiobacteraeota bacterium]|nr:NAD(P)/FAD-dependent oxidoreductase [Candidatus Eremiobacteraeota bacterium]
MDINHLDRRKTALIIGAGPAGLTAAYELLEKTDVIPIIYELTDSIGGISRTIDYKGNRIDMGGHRFFSKSDMIIAWWARIMPFQDKFSHEIAFPHRKHRGSRIYDTSTDTGEKGESDKVMLIRQRISRILFLGKFFDYPISLNLKTLKNLGIIRVFRIGLSYLRARVFTVKEKNLEDFFINRFGEELYRTFFKDYTEKVWGIPCNNISAEWGAQRIKGLSISKAALHIINELFKNIMSFLGGKRQEDLSSLTQKDKETSLISHFLYPKYGPGQLWEEVADIIRAKGARIFLNHEVIGIKTENDMISGMTVKNTRSGEEFPAYADYYISTMPVKDLIVNLEAEIPAEINEIANGLLYRDFITVGILASKLKFQNGKENTASNHLIPDNWIYIQDRNVRLGRLQIFNNWSPHMVSDPHKVWLGLEYFCTEGDELWNMEEAGFVDFAINEAVKIGILDREDVLDATRIRLKKAYPAYFGTYSRFSEIKEYLSRFENLYCIGRNGMHRYNNMDHSMMTAMTAVANIRDGVKTKENIWGVNTELQYHENRAATEKI